jgi:hypothetical protein
MTGSAVRPVPSQRRVIQLTLDAIGGRLEVRVEDRVHGS